MPGINLNDMNKASEAPHSSPVAMPPPLAVRGHMTGRDMHELHRSSTPLEALFDLTTVVAVAAAATRLHHSLIESGVREAGLEFVQSFFAIWWPWMSYTWFASAYDTDDVPFRMARRRGCRGSGRRARITTDSSQALDNGTYPWPARRLGR